MFFFIFFHQGSDKAYKFYQKTKKEDIEALVELKEFIKKIYSIFIAVYLTFQRFLVVNSINLNNIKILKDYAIKIHQTIKRFSGAPAILIYLERVKLLTKEKYQEMAQIDIKIVKLFS